MVYWKVPGTPPAGTLGDATGCCGASCRLEKLEIPGNRMAFNQLVVVLMKLELENPLPASELLRVVPWKYSDKDFSRLLTAPG